MSLGLLAAPVLAVCAVAARVHRFGQRPTRLPARPLPAIVLGARVFRDGTSSAALIERVRLGVELLTAGKATGLIFSGGTPDGRPTEALVMYELARTLGAVSERLTLEADSRSTFENAQRCAETLPFREVLLVTCDFHLLRATNHFRRAGFAVHPVASRRALTLPQRLAVTSRELFALARRPWLAW